MCINDCKIEYLVLKFYEQVSRENRTDILFIYEINELKYDSVLMFIKCMQLHVNTQSYS